MKAYSFSQCNCGAGPLKKQPAPYHAETGQTKKKPYPRASGTGACQYRTPYTPLYAAYTPSVHKKQTAEPNKNMEPEVSSPVLVGYWFEWPPRIDLATIPPYNVMIVAFMQTGPNGIPTFSPLYMTDEQFIAAVEMLKCQGREVLISLGGAYGEVALTRNDKQAFIDETIRIVDKYGFTGFDIDLEFDSVTAADNQTVIPEALIEIKNHYLRQNKKFMITLAPEFPSLRGADAPYAPYIQKLEGCYDLIFPQYYNQNLDGIWSYELNMWLPQNSNEYKAQFLYTLTHAIVTGTQDYIQIPADKFAIGLPATREAAFDGYVENPDDVAYAFDRLDAEGNCIRGLMTWAINYDAGTGYQFVSNYAPLVFSRCGRCVPPVVPPAPVVCPPENLRAVSIAYSSVGLEWDPCVDKPEVLGYVVCRNNMEVGRVSGDQTSFLDTGLNPNTEYSYTVKAFDSDCNYSEPSNELPVTTGREQTCNGTITF